MKQPTIFISHDIYENYRAMGYFTSIDNAVKHELSLYTNSIITDREEKDEDNGKYVTIHLLALNSDTIKIELFFTELYITA